MDLGGYSADAAPVCVCVISERTNERASSRLGLHQWVGLVARWQGEGQFLSSCVCVCVCVCRTRVCLWLEAAAAAGRERERAGRCLHCTAASAAAYVCCVV